MSNTTNAKAGLDALLTPDNCVLILIDHQPFQFAGLRSHDTQSVINNVVGLAKSAKVFGVPTLFTTVVQDRGGYLLKQLQDVFPEQKPIDRTFINTWEDAARHRMGQEDRQEENRHGGAVDRDHPFLERMELWTRQRGIPRKSGNGRCVSYLSTRPSMTRSGLPLARSPRRWVARRRRCVSGCARQSATKAGAGFDEHGA